MSRERRLKASDIFRETEFPFARKTTFENAYPTIEDIAVEVIEVGDNVSEARRHYNKSNAGEYIDCSNKLCYSGGFCLGEIIRYMIMTNKTEHQTQEFCRGYEGSPKGRRKYRGCYHRFDVKIKIKYKEQQED